MKILLLGYYGHKNFGDDLLLSIVSERLSNNPLVTKIGVSCSEMGSNYISAMAPWIDRIETMPRRRSFIGDYDRVIFGGGGTVFEYRKNLSCLYRLKKKLSEYLEYGRAFRNGTKFASLGLGIGPFADTAGRKMAMNRMKYHSLVLTRDATSQQHAVDFGLNAHQSHDLSFLEFPKLRELAESSKTIERNNYCFIVRHYKYGESADQYLNPMIELAKSLLKEGCTVTWMSFQEEYDSPVIDRIRNANMEVWIWDPVLMRHDDVYKEINKSNVVVTARMHGTYIAGMLGVPTVSIGLHPKLELASKYFSKSTILDVNLSFQDLKKAVAEISSQDVNESETGFSKSEQAFQELNVRFSELNDWLQT